MPFPLWTPLRDLHSAYILLHPGPWVPLWPRICQYEPPSPFSSPLLLDLLVQEVAAVTDHYVRPGLSCLPSLSVPSYLPSPSPTNYMGWLTHKAEWRSALGNSSLAQAPETSSTCHVSLSFTSLLLHPYQWLLNSRKGPNPMAASLTVPIVHPASFPGSAHPGLSPSSNLRALWHAHFCPRAFFPTEVNACLPLL